MPRQPIVLVPVREPQDFLPLSRSDQRDSNGSHYSTVDTEQPAAQATAPLAAGRVFRRRSCWRHSLIHRDCGRCSPMAIPAGTYAPANWCCRHGHVPVTDPFSFSRPRQPWFAWEWLADVVIRRGMAVARVGGACLRWRARRWPWRPRHYWHAFSAWVRIVDRAGGDNGGGERIERTLPGAAARLFDTFLHARALGSGRRSRAPPAAVCGCWCR